MIKEEREEAIEVFEGMVKTAEIHETFTIPRSVMIRAQKTALEALKAEPCEDCISREAVIDELKWIEEYGMLEMNRALKLITDLPSVTPARKKGKWVVKIVGKPESGGTLGKYICDQCQKAIWATAIEGEPNFCPICGTEMEGESE